MFASIAEIFRRRSVIWGFFRTEMKIRYRRSALGFLWSLLNPLLMMLVLTMVFSAVMRIEIMHGGRRIPYHFYVGVAAAVAVLVFAAGMFIFTRFQDRFVFRL